MDIKIDKHTVLIFDLDDTLYNELDYLKSAYKAIANTLDPSDWKSLYSIMFSMYRSKLNVFEYLVKNYKVEIKTLIDLYRNHQPNIKLYDGVKDVFDAIKSKNGKIGIITDGRSKTQRAKIENLGILNYLDKIIISDELGSEKPCLANFIAIENAIKGTNYYYIADNLKKDFIAPNSLGWQTIGLIDNGKNIHYKSYKYMDIEHQPHQFIFSFNEINIT